jgi:uncharacterized protein (TIGR03437 family)
MSGLLRRGIAGLVFVVTPMWSAEVPAPIRTPLVFEPNRGQAEADVRFVGHGKRLTLLMRDRDVRMLLDYRTPAGKLETDTVTMRIEGAAPKSATALNATGGVSNYLYSRRITGVPHYSKVSYSDLLPRTDLLFYGQDGRFEFDFIVHPGASPNAIRLAFDGAKSLRLNKTGDLLIETSHGTLVQQHPVIYQNDGAARREISGRFQLLKGNRVSFVTGAYNPKLDLIIDPALTYSAYIGGLGNDYANAIAIDSSGSAYVAGATASTNFPTATAGFRRSSNTTGSLDAYIVKMNPAGSALVYSTYFGGQGDDIISGIAVDPRGNAIAAGTTNSEDFPTTSAAYQSRYRGGGSNPGDAVLRGDAFVVKIKPDGSDFVYATYLGGAQAEQATDVATDAGGNAYVVGSTSSTAFPTSADAYQPNFGGSGDGFFSKLNPDGSTLVYSTFLGGNQVDGINAVTVDASNNVFVTGATSSPNFPKSNGAYQTGLSGNSDAFVTKFNANGTLGFSTYFGSTITDIGQSIALDAQGRVYVAGTTNSPQLPLTSTALQPVFGGGPTDAFLAIFDPTGATLAYSTFFGGSKLEDNVRVGLDPTGNILLVLSTESNTFIGTRDAFQQRAIGAQDVLIIKLDPAGKNLLFGSFLGGTGVDVPTKIVVDSIGNLYVSGNTQSNDFPTVRGSYAPPFSDAFDGFLFKVAFIIPQLTATPSVLTFNYQMGDPAPAGIDLQIDSAGVPTALNVTVDPPGRWLVVTPTTSQTPAKLKVTVSPSGFPSGTYQGTITITAPGSTTAPLTINTTLDISLPAPKSSFLSSGVVNGASFLPGALAAGEIITLFGSNFGPQDLVGVNLTGDGRFDTRLADTRLLFDGNPAPLIYVTAGQLSAIVPYAVANQTSTQLQIEYKGTKSNPVLFQTTDASPALFAANSSGRGQGAILNEDGSVNSNSNPARRGSIVVLYATGEGQTNPAGVDGQLALSTYPKPKLPVTVKVNNQNAEVLYYGAAPGLVAGAMQINVRIPSDAVLPPSGFGQLPIIVNVGANASPAAVTVAVTQ